MLPIIICICIVFTIIGCSFYWCCYGKREIDTTRHTFANVDGTPKPISGTVFFNNNMYAAALFPTADAKWNVTISDTAKARKDRVVGLQLYDFEEADVFVRPPTQVYWGFTAREWIMWVPSLIGSAGPIIVTFQAHCDAISFLPNWIRIACAFKIFWDVYGFVYRLDSPHADPTKKKILNAARLAMIGICAWGMTYTWPHAGSGLAEKDSLDCDPVMFYVGFVFSTVPLLLMVCLLTATVITNQQNQFEFDGEESKKTEEEKFNEERCCCPSFIKMKLVKENELDVELSVSEV